MRSVPPLTFKVANYSGLKAKGEVWSSPHFFSQPGGYKMILTIHCGGHKDVKDHLSLFVSQCPGPKDDEMVWPFNGSVTIQILNQLLNDSHHSKTIAFSFVRSRLATDDERSVGRGRTKFVSHVSLEKVSDTCRYVKDDCIFFRVTNVRVDSFCQPWLICSPS